MNQEILGELENTRCPEIIKILSIGKRTGRLCLTNGAETANIYFQEGQINHAQCGAFHGEKAIHESAIWGSGEYRFYVDDTPDMLTVNHSVDEILAESAKQIRQMERITSLIPSNSMVYELEPEFKDREITIKSIQWKVLVHIDGKRSIADIGQIIGLGVSDAMKVFYTIIRLGLIKEASETRAEKTDVSIELPDTPFVSSIKDALTRAMGPIAPFIIIETAHDMDLDLLNDNMDSRASLIETLSSRIPGESLSLNFLDTMTDWLNTGMDNQ
ncbi:MAG: DUF4388 domain-containing protein [Thermodesulfobacteriota bacterium]|nr:DUF4388 domain-containing protein [Thermodesulfobacteriota bacterium]